MAHTVCVICQRREPTAGAVCPACRLGVHTHLSDLAILAPLLPAAAEPGRAASQRVAGSREQPTGTRVIALDLSSPLRPSGRAVDGVRDPYQDQAGPVPVAAWLDVQVRYWAELRGHEAWPVPTVAAMVGWLRGRVDWAAGHHPALEVFAAELGWYSRAVRRLLNLDTRPVYLRGRYCPRCDAADLWQDLPDLDGRAANHPVNCRDCGSRWSWDEYHQAQQGRARLYAAGDLT